MNFSARSQHLESECKAYHWREYNRLNRIADQLAAKANRLPTGSPAWQEAARKFTEHCNAAEARGYRLI